MREFHHIGIPSQKKRSGETYLEGAKVHVTAVDADPMKIEWLRFEPDSPMPAALQMQTHLAYKVESIEAELKGQQVLIPPFTPMPGVTVAFIMHDGVPVEFMEITA